MLLFKKNKIRFKFHMILFIAAGIISLSLYSCYPGSGTAVEDFDLVATFFNKDADFGSAQTYYMVDSVYHFTGDSTKPDSDLISRKFDKDIITEVVKNMNARGYTRLASIDPQNLPDIVVLLGASATKNFNIYSWFPPYFPGWGYPGYGWGWYPWYPWGGSTATSYTTGTLLVNLMDGKHADLQNKQIPVMWNAAMNGVLSSSKNNNASRVLQGINQAFTQSPYILRIVK